MLSRPLSLLHCRAGPPTRHLRLLSPHHQSSAEAMAGGSSLSWGPSPAAVMALVAMLGLGVAAYIVGPPLYWHVAEALGRSPGTCHACACDCDAVPLLQLPEDCAKQFKEVKSRASSEETELLIEELKLREEEAMEAQQQADVKLLEAKKLASQYQKEADKCSSGMDTCEEAREKSTESLLGQRKLTALWEERARELMETRETTPE